MVRVLAVDPGLTRCGAAVVDGGPGRALVMRHAGVLTTDPREPLARRLLHLEEQLQAVFVRYDPASIAVERVFSQRNVPSAMATAQAAAVALLLAARRGLQTYEHTPTAVKAAVTGNGRAGKSQVAVMVTKLLGLPAPPTPVDATDALALAICHLWQQPYLERVRAAQA